MWARRQRCHGCEIGGAGSDEGLILPVPPLDVDIVSLGVPSRMGLFPVVAPLIVTSWPSHSLPWQHPAGHSVPSVLAQAIRDNV